MFKMSSSNLLIILSTASSLTIISSHSIIPVWVALEVISFCLPPLISSQDQSLMSKINSWKYYMIQCYASSVFILSALCMSFSSPLSSYSNILWTLIFSSMMIKMGLYPFHGWLFQISSSISWENFLILSTIQKIGPLVLISEITKEMSSNISVELCVSLVVSIFSMSIIFISSTRNFLIASSIVNSMWVILASQLSSFSLTYFMGFYFIHLLVIFSALSTEFSLTMSSLSYSSGGSFSAELFKSISFLSIIGIPPLTGFFMKLSVLENMVSQGQVFSSLIMTFSSSIFLFVYLKMNNSFFNSMKNEKLQFKSKSTTPLLLPTLLIGGGMSFLM